MRKIILFITCFYAFNCVGQDYTKVNPVHQKKYLIKELKNIYIGSTEAKLKKVKPGIDLLLKNKNQTIKSIDYQLNSEGSIYEFIIEYKPNFDVTKMMLKKYGEPNSETFPGEWEVWLQDGLKLKIWQYKNKLCIADASQF